MNLVYTHENSIAVQSAKNILEMRGIDCFYKNEHGNTMGREFGMSNLLELWVKNSKDYEKAKSIIEKQIASSEEKTSWICNECNEKNEGNFEICWKCQTEKKSS